MIGLVATRIGVVWILLAYIGDMINTPLLMFVLALLFKPHHCKDIVAHIPGNLVENA